MGHRNILNFSREYRQGNTVEEHTDWIIDSWNSIINQNDTVWILGDVVFGGPGKDIPGPGWKELAIFNCLNGTKNLVMGNHDRMPTDEYCRYFTLVKGFIRYKEFWLSHPPIHPAELRGSKNIHGHVHHNTIQDPNYINVCIEANIQRNGTIFTSLDEIRLL